MTLPRTLTAVHFLHLARYALVLACTSMGTFAAEAQSQPADTSRDSVRSRFAESAAYIIHEPPTGHDPAQASGVVIDDVGHVLTTAHIFLEGDSTTGYRYYDEAVCGPYAFVSCTVVGQLGTVGSGTRFSVVRLPSAVELNTNSRRDFSLIRLPANVRPPAERIPSICMNYRPNTDDTLHVMGFGSNSALNTARLTDARFETRDTITALWAAEGYGVVKGFSGGAVFNQDGHLAGIVKGGETGGIFYFVPASTVIRDLEAFTDANLVSCKPDDRSGGEITGSVRTWGVALPPLQRTRPAPGMLLPYQDDGVASFETSVERLDVSIEALRSGFCDGIADCTLRIDGSDPMTPQQHLSDVRDTFAELHERSGEDLFLGYAFEAALALDDPGFVIAHTGNFYSAALMDPGLYAWRSYALRTAALETSDPAAQAELFRSSAEALSHYMQDNPGESWAFAYRATLHAALDQRSEALVDLERAQQIEQGVPGAFQLDTYNESARAYWLLGEPELARESASQVIELYGDFDSANRIAAFGDPEFEHPQQHQ